MTSDFLTDLDTGRCACRCGRRITGRSPSAFYASEDCAAAWHYRQRQAVWQQLEAWFEPLQKLRQAVADTVRQIANAFADMARALHRQIRVLLPPEPPADPRQRALWLRQHRNTGPTPHARAPRAINPPAGFGTAPTKVVRPPVFR